MTKDPVLTCFVLATLWLSIICGFVSHFATRRLAKWLYHHRRDLWRDLGFPETGDPEKGYSSRTTALRNMDRTMHLLEDRWELPDEDAKSCFRQHRLGRLFGIILLGLFVAGIFYGVLRDRDRGSMPAGKPALNPVSAGER